MAEYESKPMSKFAPDWWRADVACISERKRFTAGSRGWGWSTRRDRPWPLKFTTVIRSANNVSPLASAWQRRFRTNSSPASAFKSYGKSSSATVLELEDKCQGSELQPFEGFVLIGWPDNPVTIKTHRLIVGVGLPEDLLHTFVNE